MNSHTMVRIRKQTTLIKITARAVGGVLYSSACVRALRWLMLSIPTQSSRTHADRLFEEPMLRCHLPSRTSRVAQHHPPRHPPRHPPSRSFRVAQHHPPRHPPRHPPSRSTQSCTAPPASTPASKPALAQFQSCTAPLASPLRAHDLDLTPASSLLGCAPPVEEPRAHLLEEGSRGRGLIVHERRCLGLVEIGDGLIRGSAMAGNAHIWRIRGLPTRSNQFTRLRPSRSLTTRPQGC